MSEPDNCPKCGSKKLHQFSHTPAWSCRNCWHEWIPGSMKCEHGKMNYERCLYCEHKEQEKRLAELRARVAKLEAKKDRYRETICEFLSTVLTIKRENQPEWMEYLAERINEVCDVIGEDDRFAFDPRHDAVLPIKKWS